MSYVQFNNNLCHWWQHCLDLGLRGSDVGVGGGMPFGSIPSRLDVCGGADALQAPQARHGTGFAAILKAASAVILCRSLLSPPWRAPTLPSPYKAPPFDPAELLNVSDADGEQISLEKLTRLHAELIRLPAELVGVGYAAMTGVTGYGSPPLHEEWPTSFSVLVSITRRLLTPMTWALREAAAVAGELEAADAADDDADNAGASADASADTGSSTEDGCGDDGRPLAFASDSSKPTGGILDGLRWRRAWRQGLFGQGSQGQGRSYGCEHDHGRGQDEQGRQGFSYYLAQAESRKLTDTIVRTRSILNRLGRLQHATIAKGTWLGGFQPLPLSLH